ncbi:hypothetical protein ACAG26_22185 [Mycobacterium sp. pUA109]|uniref:hypothetical protein n=1 Tax=Mycobacterium sp. pUA109 TaxID=3238982 RepID=UPI00351BC4BA
MSGDKIPDRPPARIKGMLGPNTADEFGKFGDYEPPALRSQIDDFTYEDARSVLDGDVTAAESRRIAKSVRDAIRAGDPLPKRPHGDHRWGTGWAKAEFQPGTTEQDVVDMARRSIDAANSAFPDNSVPSGFVVMGTHRGNRLRWP